MKQLSDYGSNVYSQSGEDGCCAEIFHRIGTPSRFCVEFGAGDGLSCSNTANLWKGNWDGGALLIEADKDLCEIAYKNADRRFPGNSTPCRVVHAKVAPGNGPSSIDAIIAANTINNPAIDFMSIDVDGDDFWIACSMKCRPRVLCIEFNKTIPPHLSIQPAGPGNNYGVGVGTLKPAMEHRGYRFIGITDCNAWFVVTEHAAAFADLETDLSVLMPPERFMYLTTDQQGNMVPAGAVPPWGLRWPPSNTRFVMNQAGVLTVDSADPVEHLRQLTIREFQELSKQFAR